jgi:rhodanese-related sulfurtransferase
MLASAAHVREIDIEALAASSTDGMILDVREPAEYSRGHIPGAVNLPQADLASRLAEIPRNRPLILVCERGTRSYRVAQFLIQMGVDQVVSLRGGTAAWRAAGKALAPGDAHVGDPRVSESAWTHAGGASTADGRAA